MSKLDLKLRNLETGEYLMATFEHEHDARTWLEERPSMMEVLGVATHGLSREVYAMLKSAARPLDTAEQTQLDALDAKEKAAERARLEEEDRREREEQETYARSLVNADPNRPVHVKWTLGGGYENLNPHDPRTIDETVKAAVAAWVAERNGWVHARGQLVEEVQLVVWPGPLPAGEEHRVQSGGQFFTRTLPGL